MRRRRIIKVTLANGGKTAIIRPENIAFAMELEDTNASGQTIKFTRITPKDLVIDSELNWLDILETPEELMRKL